MVIAGIDCPRQATTEEIAERSLVVLRRYVPPDVPGVAFLSGGQTGEQACLNLDAINRLGNAPWQLTFSFGRALQYPALEVWAGEHAHVPAAQAALHHRARMAGLARSGEYTPAAESQAHG